MTGEAMDLERLKAIIDAYGARPERWPAAERQAGRALAARSAAARDLLAEAMAVDRLLDAAPTLSPTADLRAAILAAAPRRPARETPGAPSAEAWTELWRELGGWRLAGAALAASLLLGIVVGGALPTGDVDEAETDLLRMALLDDGFTGY